MTLTPLQRTPPIEVAAPVAASTRRGLLTHWRFRAPDCDPSLPLAERVLAARGVSDPRFLDAPLKDLHDPSRMPDLDKAAARILDALDRDQSIVIYADYDVDGVSAAAILWHVLHALRPGCRVSTYLPHRLEEGYGLNSQAIATLADQHDLIISVDCGITAAAPALQAKSRGKDLIITDHHTPPHLPQDLPDAFALVHPLTPGREPYPFPHLCGAGVAYKLAWRLATLRCGTERVAPPLRALLLELLSLAAMGVIADVVPLVGENRIIARYGLSQITRSSLVGVRALCAEADLHEGVEAADVGFRLGPRLNAIGRLGHAREALELLTTTDPARAHEIAAALTGWNNDRRRIEADISKHAEALAVERGMTSDDHRAIVLADPGWHRGVIGICCSRLVGLFHRPTILLQHDGDLCHGSGRSIDGFDLHDALSACSAHLETFGGHTMAAGLKLRTANLDAFRSALVTYANERLTPADLITRTVVDAEINTRDLHMDAVVRLAALAPFGRENPEPRLLLRNATIAGTPRCFGSAGHHVSFDIECRGTRLRVKFWSGAAILAKHQARLAHGTRLDMLCMPAIDTWNGNRRIEAVLHDLCILTD
ncbi:MAG TPA: single-stranded-DNA-specific exonuclease RecJ [Phycisphaerales bacterium]